MKKSSIDHTTTTDTGTYRKIYEGVNSYSGPRYVLTESRAVYICIDRQRYT
jgi:hypothetical protein